MTETAITFMNNNTDLYYVLPDNRAIRIRGNIDTEYERKIVSEKKQKKCQRYEVFMTTNDVTTQEQWIGAFMAWFGGVRDGYTLIKNKYHREYLSLNQRNKMTGDIIKDIIEKARGTSRGFILGIHDMVLSQNLCLGITPEKIASGLLSPEREMTMYPLKNLRKRKTRFVQMYSEKLEAYRCGTTMARSQLLQFGDLFGTSFDGAEWFITKVRKMQPIIGIMNDIGISVVLAPAIRRNR